ncbi:MAG: hypothetical protein ACXWQQ_11070 [Pseudobdellovibrio sp.]
MKYFLILVLFSVGCAKQIEISATDELQKTQQDSSKKTSADPDQLTVTFDDAKVSANPGDLVHQHLLLSKKMSIPVTVTVTLTDSSAISPQDFSGFVSGNRRSQAIVIEPETLVGHFPKIAVTKQAHCGGKFFIQLSDTDNQNLALGPPETIEINCP